MFTQTRIYIRDIRSSLGSFLISGIVVTLFFGWLIGFLGIFADNSFPQIFVSLTIGLVVAVSFSVWWIRDQKKNMAARRYRELPEEEENA